MKKYFFDEWKNKTEIERRAIESFRKGLELILQTVPRDELVSVYAKGSFIMREMNEKSDIDFVTVLRSTKYASRLKKLHQEYAHKISPEVQLNPCYSLWELKTGKKRKIAPPNQHPGSVVNHLDDFKLVYGEHLDKTDFKGRDPEKDMKALARVIYETFIPNVEKKFRGDATHDTSMGFSSLLKSVLWLAESELKNKQVSYEYSYAGIDKAVSDPRHIAHDAYRLRQNPTKDEKVRKEFVEKLKKHCEGLLK